MTSFPARWAERLRELSHNRWRVYDRSLSITREGAVVILATFLIGAAAINTGNNLLYLLVAMLLATVTVSGVLSEMVLRGIIVERRLPPSPHAGSLAAIRYRLTNAKKRFPSFALVVEDTVPAERGALVIYLAAGQTAVVESAVRFGKRGRAVFETLEVATRFPFGLFKKRKIVSLPADLIVYPSLSAAGDAAPHGGGYGEDVAVHTRGHGEELHDLRDYGPGDSFRDIHWKTTARRGELTSQDREDEDRPRMTLVFDTEGLGTSPVDAYALERAISQAAGVAKHWEGRGYLVRLVTACGEVPFGRGAAHVHRVWEHLALFAVPREPAPVLTLGPGEAHLIIRPDRGRHAPLTTPSEQVA